MTKKFLTLGILTIILAGVLAPSVALGQELVGKVLQTTGNVAFGPLFALIGSVLMLISSFVLITSGWIFDTVIQFTIVEMSQNIGGAGGMGASITTAWATLRDVANMCFIFVLLFAAFKAMFNLDFGGLGRTVINIIVVALLINFSLFFSKVVIDASNIVSVGFYNSITANNAQMGSTVWGGTANFRGISGGYMRMLKMQTWYDTNVLSGGLNAQNIFLTGFMSSAFMLVSAVIFLIAGIMFAARFIILIFLMILSPLALIAYIIPGQKGQFDKWKDALIDQSFFAPLFFALTWVAFKLGNSLVTPAATTWIDLLKNPTANQAGALTLLLNYVLTTGFFIAALIFAKSMASKTAGFKAISGGIGTAAIGGAALAGRQTIGRASGLISETQREKWSKSAAGRAGLWLADKGKKGSFDVRATETLGKVPGLGKELDIMGKAGGKGGFAKAVEEKAERKAKYAKEVYGQTGAEKEKAEELKEKYEKGDNKKNYDTAVENEKKVVTDAEKKAKEEKEKADKELETKKKEAEQATNDRRAGKITAQTEFEIHEKVKQAEEELRKKAEAHDLVITRRKSVIDDKNYSEATKVLEKLAEVDKQAWEKIKNVGIERQRAYAERLDEGLPGTGWLGRFQPNQGYKAAARKVRAEMGGKSKKERLADLAKEVVEEEEKAKGESGGKTGKPPPVTPPPATP